MQKITDIFLTKEAFEQYSVRLREEQARKYGMTLDEWDTAVLTSQPIYPITQQTNSAVTGSYKP